MEWAMAAAYGASSALRMPACALADGQTSGSKVRAQTPAQRLAWNMRMLLAVDNSHACAQVFKPFECLWQPPIASPDVLGRVLSPLLDVPAAAVTAAVEKLVYPLLTAPHASSAV
jgi:hypothetical protein